MLLELKNFNKMEHLFCDDSPIRCHSGDSLDVEQRTDVSFRWLESEIRIG